MCVNCFIIPPDVLMRLSRDKKIDAVDRKNLLNSAQLSEQMRAVRVQTQQFTAVMAAHSEEMVEIAAAPANLAYDCKHGHALPGSPVAHPETSKDASVKNAFAQAAAVAKFYADVFGRNSIDNHGLTLQSSVHFNKRYNNAMWNGTQMIYGDGDGKLFVDFTRSSDVIGHELTHGVTQYTVQLNYSGDAGGLNESLSDCFGSMFRQWSNKEDVKKADWLIGHEIMGAAATARGYTCLRDMADPAAKHCLAPQPTKYAQVTPGMDPHYSSGPPNLAFCTACVAAEGNSWETVGQVWYHAMVDFPPSPDMTMKAFAARTRQVATTLFKTKPQIAAAVDKGWTTVGL